MTERFAYAVIGRCGRYEDVETWIRGIFLDEHQANSDVQRLNAWLTENHLAPGEPRFTNDREDLWLAVALLDPRAPSAIVADGEATYAVVPVPVICDATALSLKCEQAASWLRREPHTWRSGDEHGLSLMRLIPDLLDAASALLHAFEVTWIVNEDGEFGVRVGDQNFWYYKWPTTWALTGQDKPWRPVNKREFGETIKVSGKFDFGTSIPASADSVAFSKADRE